MTVEQCKELVKNIFGEEAANESDIVQFYMDVNKTAYDMAMHEAASEAWDAAIDYARECADWSVSKNALVDRETYLKKYNV